MQRSGIAWSFVLSVFAILSFGVRPARAEDLTGPALVIPFETKAPLHFEPRPIAGPLELPWGIAFLPDGRILITERPGRLRIIQNGSLLTMQVEGVPEVIWAGHSGLLDVLADREFAFNHRIFLSYTHGVPGAINLRIMSAVLDDDILRDQKVIFDSQPAIPGYDEVGGRLAYGPDGLIYLTLGDRAQKERAQDLMDHSGSIIRIREDGTIPDDNPFVGRADALPEIYTYGHRNAQGLVLSQSDGRFWSVEHGPYGGDELNLIEKGGNYGWPLVSYGIEYDGSKISDEPSAPGLVDPVYKWIPDIAPSSLAYYDGDVMPENWKHSLLIGTLAGERLIRLSMEDGGVRAEEQTLHHKIGRIRNVAVGPDGYVYLLGDGRSAQLYRLEPSVGEIAERDAEPSSPGR